MADSPVARPALQHPADEGEGLGLRHRAGGHGAVVARVELPPPPTQCHGRRGHSSAALFLRFSIHIGIKINAAALRILCAQWTGLQEYNENCTGVAQIVGQL